MRHGLRTRRSAVLPLVALLAAGTAGAAEPPEGAPAPPDAAATASPEEDARGRAVLQRMAEYLAARRTGAVTVRSTYDVVQPNGQKLEFGESRRIVWRRPDGLRVDAVGTDGSCHEVVYDGRNISLAHPQERAYTTVAAPADLDRAIDHFTTDLGMRFPLKELLSSDLPQQLPSLVLEARYVGAETIDGRTYDHVAARGADADVQVWVPQQGDPMPHRLVITYRDEPGAPQYRASFRDFDATPDLAADTFVFTPPPGAERLAIVLPPEPVRGEP